MPATDKSQPEDAAQAIVQTPYGRGLILRTRRADNIKEVQLLEWESVSSSFKRTNHPIMLYTSEDYPSVRPHVGDDVICSYGRGRIKEISLMPPVQTESPTNKTGHAQRVKYSIVLSSWRLRGRSTVTCHIISPPPRVVRKHTLSEMDAHEKVELAQSQKFKATEFFSKKKDYTLALNAYAGALDAVRNVQHDHSSTNEVRADLVVTMVTCSNNSATCCIKLKKWEEATRFAQNSLILLDALYAKKGLKIHSILNKEGTIDTKLFGEWRVKSYLVIARSAMERDDEEGAIAVLKKAKVVAMEYIDDINSKQQSSINKQELDSLKILTSQMKEVRRLMADCAEKKKATKIKEKKRAQKMFAQDKDAPSNKAASRISKAGVPDETAEGKTKGNDAPCTDAPDEKSSAPVLKGVLNDKKCDRPTIRKSVSFSLKPPQIKEFDSSTGDEDLPWYSRHKEALAMVAIAGFSVVAIASLRKLQRAS
ncbi:hypothetical protein HJC23_004614 [Cyclotella cryptica]|uniref:Peptidylprolyl isomerase n=1 Tax=Cyclotella cryptica TaxID=29204 RepID=A0ABD3QGB4_9STRA|eukprot:CCRYP_005932-RA/>CCRYP_005932-RA protein AED:0.01 eAED:0.00 QI:0/0/0/1/1/1/2/0/479